MATKWVFLVDAGITKHAAMQGKVVDWRALKELVARRGPVVLALLFAPAGLTHIFTAARRHGFQIVASPEARYDSDKLEDSVDIDLISLGNSLGIISDNDTGFVVVANDRHMTNVVSSLQLLGKEVIVIGTEIAGALRDVAGIDNIRTLPLSDHE